MDPTAFQPAPLPQPAALGWTRAEDGTFVVGAAAGAELRYAPERPPTPLTARVACLSWLTECDEASGGQLDACVQAVPRCRTAPPWQEPAPCCPDTCTESYAALRLAGREPLDALDGVLGSGAECVPGYQSWVNGAAP